MESERRERVRERDRGRESEERKRERENEERVESIIRLQNYTYVSDPKLLHMFLDPYLLVVMVT